MSKRSSKRSEITPSLRALAMPLARLKPDPANLRLHDDRSIDALKASLVRFGQQKPVVIDRGGIVRAGNGTVEAARRLGWTHIAAVRSDLKVPEVKAYAIADNRIPELSAWDQEALSERLPDVGDLASCGFTEKDLKRLQATTADSEDAAEFPAPPPAPVAVSRTGDLWEIGEQRLLCGDATDPNDIDRVMGGEKAALCATDPPYLVDYTGERTGGTGKDWSAVYRETEIGDAGDFFRAVFENIVRVLSPNAPLYCWHATRRYSTIETIWRELGILDHQVIVWVKPSPVFGSSFYHFRHEPCLMGWVQGDKPAHDGRHDHDSVWSIAGNQDRLELLPRVQLLRLLREALDVWHLGWEGGKSRPVGNEHPTQKPVEIFARPMRKHTNPGAVTFEPFSGSGSQIIAAEQVGRRCRALEIQPVFVDVAVRRWQSMTRQPARLAGDGRTWAEIAKARGVDLEPAPCPSAPDAHVASQAAATSPTVVGVPSTPKPTPGPPRKGPRPRAATGPSGGRGGRSSSNETRSVRAARKRRRSK